MNRIKSFERYLEEQRLRRSTILGHLQDLRRFQKWCKDLVVNPTAVTYNDLLKFIESMQEKGSGKRSINLHLNSIRKYFEYLIQLEIRKDNPARDLRLKNTERTVRKQLLTPDQLDALYTRFQMRQQWEYKGEYTKKTHRRNIVSLGLLVYQGVQSSELSLLEKGHLNLLQGTVYIPSSPKGNSRILKLNASQILAMQNYLQDLPKDQEKLFANVILSNALTQIMKALRKSFENEKINGPHIRASVIMNWLKLHNIRQVQYMAGHKQISTTERYKEQDIGDLQKQLEQFHPFR